MTRRIASEEAASTCCFVPSALPGIPIGIAGTGSCLPNVVVSNDELAALIAKAGKGADWARAKLGIDSRRFMTPLDAQGRPTGAADELDMAEEAARKALASAQMPASEIDLVWYVSCTQRGHTRHHFSKSVFELHKRLELRPDAVPLEMDAGCGGAVHALILGASMLVGSGKATALIVASNAPSRYYGDWQAYVDADVWLSMYVFGDGAGAAVLRSSDALPSRSRILASHLGVDPDQPLMAYEPRGQSPEPLYVIDARSVAASFGVYAKRALDGLQEAHRFDFLDIARFYFHQVNGNVLQKFVERIGLPKERVAVHVDRYGNIAAAATLALLDEDVRSGAVSPGDLIVVCTVGAGAQFGAALVQL